MRYEVQQTPQAERDFCALPRHIQKRIARWYQLLVDDPRRAGTRQFEGHRELRRVHASKDYVIVYAIRDEQVLVLIVRVAHHKDVYRRL